MPKTNRYDRIDALRAIAIVWMTLFHFCYDLNHFGWLHQDFLHDPAWTGQRTAIVSLFLFCAGLSQAVAVVQGQRWPRFWRRWSQVAGCAVLVSIGTWFVFHERFIWFGVLHGIATMLILVRLTAGWGNALWLTGALAVAAAWAAPFAHHAWPALDVLNAPAFSWLGFISRKPLTEDYVPVLPWLGVMWWGMAAGQWVLRARPQWVQGPLPRAAAPLAWLGRHSLGWYMLHQPVLFGAMLLLR